MEAARCRGHCRALTLLLHRKPGKGSKTRSIWNFIGISPLIRENLHETIDFPSKYGVFRFQFSRENQSIDGFNPPQKLVMITGDLTPATTIRVELLAFGPTFAIFLCNEKMVKLWFMVIP